MDGDGIKEIAVSAPEYDDGGTSDCGRIYLLPGAVSPPGGHRELWTFPSPTAGRELGTVLAAAGDVDGDGFEDVLAGMPKSDSATYSDAGKISLFSGTDGSFLAEYWGAGAGELGTSAAAMGDLDGDGFGDIAVGEPDFDPHGHRDAGRVLLLSGGALVHGGDPRLLSIPGLRNAGKLGTSVARIQDWDGDGKDDVLAGAPFATNGSIGSQNGVVQVFSSATGDRLKDLEGPTDLAMFGTSVAQAGDLDHDGVDDLIVGAKNYSLSFPGGSGSEEGAVFAISRARLELIFVQYGNFDGAHLGTAIAPLDDVDGDGTDDLVAGAPDADVLGSYEGRVSLYGHDPYLTVSQHTASVVFGATIDYEMVFPTTDAGREYRLLLSRAARGSSFLGATEIPLTRDGLYRSTVRGVYPVFMTGGAGTLDADGDATATLSFSSLPLSFLGTTLYAAAVVWPSGWSEPHRSSICKEVRFIL